MIDSFEKILSKHIDIIKKVCFIYGKREEDRKDLFQEISIQAWKSFKHFRGDSKVSTWLYRVATNVAITQFRKKQKEEVLINFSDTMLSPRLNEEKDGQESLLSNLYRAIEDLNDIEKNIVFLYLDGMTYKEMEDVLGISQGNLRTKMNRIKNKLKISVKNY